MTDKDALLRNICAHPEDDAPRLVYADWLEEHGEGADLARADFIRAQVALARAAPDDPAIPSLRQREKRALRGNRARWLAERPAWAAKGDFHRGFLVPRLREPA